MTILTEELVVEDAYLIVKRGLYYRPGASGYTGVKEHAGRYTRAEAEAHADEASGVTFIAETDAPDYTDACYPDIALKHALARAEAAEARILGIR